MMAQSLAKSSWEINNCGKYINQFPLNTIKSIRQYERINKKICRQKMCIIFNEICINEETLPIYIYIYIYIYISGDSSLFLLLVPPPPSVNFSSQPVVRGPKVSHHSCYCVILHCIAQIDKRTLHGVFFFCKQSRYYIICSLEKMPQKQRMGCFRLLLEHLAWIEDQDIFFLSKV